MTARTEAIPVFFFTLHLTCLVYIPCLAYRPLIQLQSQWRRVFVVFFGGYGITHVDRSRRSQKTHRFFSSSVFTVTNLLNQRSELFRATNPLGWHMHASFQPVQPCQGAKKVLPLQLGSHSASNWMEQGWRMGAWGGNIHPFIMATYSKPIFPWFTPFLHYSHRDCVKKRNLAGPSPEFTTPASGEPSPLPKPGKKCPDGERWRIPAVDIFAVRKHSREETPVG